MAYTKTKTPIVYYGGKTSIINHIMPLIPVHEVYTETFFGGGTVFFHKDPVKNETINDKLDLVINFYRTVRTNYLELRRLINATLISRKLFSDALDIINKHRQNRPVKSNKTYRVQLAWAFWLRTNFSFGNDIAGGYKYSNNSSVSVPDVLNNRKKHFTELLVHRIEHAYIENIDAIDVLKSRNVESAFHYLDPPYTGANNGHYPGYSWDDYDRLLAWLQDECVGKFMLSNYNSSLLDEYVIRNGWKMKEIRNRFKGTRKISGDRYEVLIWNYTNVCGTQDIFKN